VPTIGYLHGIRCARSTALGAGLPAIPADDLDLGMHGQPGGKCLRGSVGEEVNRTVAFQIHENSAVAPPRALGPVINAEDAHGLLNGTWLGAEQAEEVGWTDRHAQRFGEAASSLPT
jgi:hypothetical protein